MKGPNFTLKNFSNTLGGVLAKTRAFSIVITLTLLSAYSYAQTLPDCNSIMACNRQVNISLDTECEQVLGADMVLEAPQYADEYYDIEAKMPNGQYIQQITVGTFNGSPIRTVRLNSAHLGMNLEIKVTLRGCGNSCWGFGRVEDKLAPTIENCPCEQRITSFSGNITQLSPTFNRPNECPVITSVNGVSYLTHNFALTAPGTINLSTNSTSVRFSVYSGPFDPNSPCLNAIETNVSSAQIMNGVVGTEYTLVVSSVIAGVPPGMMGLEYNVFVQNTGGSVMSSISSSICVIECNTENQLLNQTTINAVNRPTFTDACGGALVFTKRDVVDDMGCSSPFTKVIRRIWTATDVSGNTSEEKTQYFYVARPSLDDVVCPANWTVTCGTNFAMLPNGAPTPAVSGMPTMTNCSNIQMFYEDLKFDVCGAGIKVNRRWTIIDWCTAEEITCSQELRVNDNIAPVVTCPADLTTAEPIDGVFPAAVISVASNSCTATWDVVPPIAVFDCSFITYDVFIKLADENGGEPSGDVPFVKIDGETRVIGTSPALSATLSPTARPFRIVGLPLGRTWIKYVVTDACGNSGDCFTEIDVVDNTPPTAICEDETVVSLDDLGNGKLFAFSLDNHSNDNCSDIVKYEVRRTSTHCPEKASDLEFGEHISFCCSDVTAPESYINVVLRVYDAAGNFNDCHTRVKVQNKRPPVITCPPAITLLCGDARINAWASGSATFDTTFFGRPTISGVCADLRFGSRIISNNINAKCGTGTVVREWFLMSNPSIRCNQTLTVTAPGFIESNITFPADRTIASCDVSKATPEALNSRPIVTNQACRDIGITFVDQIFTTDADACIKILRTWKVIDWCTYPTTQRVFERTQVIKLTGSGGATWACPTSTQVFSADENQCEKEVTLTATATDECTDDDRLVYTWSLDLNKDNTVDATGTGNIVTRILPKGTHRITFTVTNRCGTITSCSYDVRINATKKPTPICIREVVWVIDDNGEAEIWASDFNLKSENNCGDDSKLKFSFNAAGTEPERTFTCADIPNGQVARIPLQMYAIDEDGNFEFCDVILILQDSPLRNVCVDKADLLPTIGGRILTETQEGVADVEVAAVNMNSYTSQKFMTQENGEYSFTGVNAFDPLAIDAQNDKDHLNGVSTLDLVMIQRHILGLSELNSPYKLIAADINNSKSITASDLTALRKLILGITDKIENNTSWKFIPAEHQFLDVLNPFDYPTEIDLDSIYEDKSNVNFIAVKVGDVNGSAKANSQSVNTESRSSSAPIVIDSKAFDAGKLVRLEVKAGDVMTTSGMQMAFRYDANDLTLSAVNSGAISVKAHNYNALHNAGGVLRFSIDIPEGVTLNQDDVIFSIDFRSLNQGHTEDIKLVSEYFAAEMYDTDYSVRPIRLLYRNTSEQVNDNILYQNEPNPFKDYTNISFELGKASQVNLRIVDVTGKIVALKNGYFEKGLHTMTFDNANLGNAGIYYYQLETPEFSATKKMILIE